MSHSSILSQLAPFCALLLACFLFSPVTAFGAGNIGEDSSLHHYQWRHGDISDVLLLLPVSFAEKYAFTKLEKLQVYFGNWLRDYSQVVDILPLVRVPEPLLRAIVCISPV